MIRTTALYIRLSEDDGNKGESNSVKNQRDLLTAYVNEHPDLQRSGKTEFVDDGYSGTDFQRPAVQKMLDLAGKGEINCIVVKDLSRFGRNYVEVCEYLEKVFPFLGVRFIAINDGYDSVDHKGSTAPLNVPFGTLIHGHYSNELSMKVRQSYVAKAKKGEFLCGAAPFGYMRSNVEKNKLVIDEEAAIIVRHIFELACNGCKTSEIARILNYDGVFSPLMYRKKKGLHAKGEMAAVGGVSIWSDRNVREIIYDERYTGIQVSGKTTKRRVGSSQSISVPESDWIKVPGAHEAIVSVASYHKAQLIISRFSKSKQDVKRTLFSGKMKCGSCGYSLGYNGSQTPFYYCNTARHTPEQNCFDGKMYVHDIKQLVLAALKLELKKALDCLANDRKEKYTKQSHKNALQELKSQTVQSEVMRRQIMTLYEKFTDKIISRDEYLNTKEIYLQKLSGIENRLLKLNAFLENDQKEGAATNITQLLEQFSVSEEVTEEIASLIHRIFLYNKEHIEIQFAFKDLTPI